MDKDRIEGNLKGPRASSPDDEEREAEGEAQGSWGGKDKRQPSRTPAGRRQGRGRQARLDRGLGDSPAPPRRRAVAPSRRRRARGAGGRSARRRLPPARAGARRPPPPCRAPSRRRARARIRWVALPRRRVIARPTRCSSSARSRADHAARHDREDERLATGLARRRVDARAPLTHLLEVRERACCTRPRSARPAAPSAASPRRRRSPAAAAAARGFGRARSALEPVVAAGEVDDLLRPLAVHDLELLLEQLEPLGQSGNGKPYAVCSSAFQPAPRPSSTRPPETWSAVAAAFASSEGWRNVTGETSVPSRIRS